LKKNERRWRGILVVPWIRKTKTRSGLELDVSQSILLAEYRLVGHSTKTMELNVARWAHSMRTQACGAGSRTAILGRRNRLLTSG
jgi:hypothetical protein